MGLQDNGISTELQVDDVGGKLTRPIASPMINTSVWSAIVAGDVRKKKASVI